jgi:hypothetical protein
MWLWEKKKLKQGNHDAGPSSDATPPVKIANKSASDDVVIPPELGISEVPVKPALIEMLTERQETEPEEAPASLH